MNGDVLLIQKNLVHPTNTGQSWQWHMRCSSQLAHTSLPPVGPMAALGECCPQWSNVRPSREHRP